MAEELRMMARMMMWLLFVRLLIFVGKWRLTVGEMGDRE